MKIRIFVYGTRLRSDGVDEIIDDYEAPVDALKAAKVIVKFSPYSGAHALIHVEGIHYVTISKSKTGRIQVKKHADLSHLEKSTEP